MSWLNAALGQSGQIGIDLGSSHLRLSQPPHESVLAEPNMLVRNTKTDRIIAIGKAAEKLRGRTPEHFAFVRPVSEGVIANPSAAVTILTRVSYQYRSWWESVLGQNFLVAIPVAAADVDVRTYANVFSHLSSRSVKAVPAPVAALRGVGVAIDDPFAQMIIDIGSDTTSVGVVSQRSLIAFDAIDMGGRELDDAIQDYVRRKRNLHVSDLQSEQIKLSAAHCGSANEECADITVHGQDTASRLPREITISPDDARRAIRPVVTELTTFVQNFLQSLSADTAADVYTHGAHLVGGTAQLPGLIAELEDVLSISVYDYDNPASAVAAGLGDVSAREGLQQPIHNFDPYADGKSTE